jgi:hypothetical protein
MGVPCFPDLVAVCSLNADKTFVNAFIMEASIDNSTREYVLSQKGPIVEDMLNMLHRVGIIIAIESAVTEYTCCRH